MFGPQLSSTCFRVDLRSSCFHRHDIVDWTSLDACRAHCSVVRKAIVWVNDRETHRNWCIHPKNPRFAYGNAWNVFAHQTRLTACIDERGPRKKPFTFGCAKQCVWFTCFNTRIAPCTASDEFRFWDSMRGPMYMELSTFCLTGG